MQSTLCKPYKDKAEFSDGFEEALREEFVCMKQGFETRITSLQEQIEELHRLKGRELMDIRYELKRETETKRLLLKKLSAFIKT